MLHQTLLNRLSWFNKLGQSNHFSAVLALSLSLILAACGGGGSSVTENNLVEPGADGVAPTLTSVTIENDYNGSAYVTPEGGKPSTVLIKIEADEALMQPTVTIGGEVAEVNGSVRSWQATREMTSSDLTGDVAFSIAFSDASGEEGVDVAATTDGSTMYYCAEGCSVGPGGVLQDTIDFEVAYATYTFVDFGPDSSTSAAVQDPTDATNTVAASQKKANAETWGGTVLSVSDLAYKLTADDGVMTVKFWSPAPGKTVRLKLENADDANVFVEADAVTTATGDWETLTFDFSLPAGGAIDPATEYAKVAIFYDFGTAGTGTDVDFYWDDVKYGGITNAAAPTFAGRWKLANEAGSAGVGPEAGNVGWWSLGAGDLTARACFMDDVYIFGEDGSFALELGDQTWLENWQSGADDACGTPIAPHDGTATDYTYTLEDNVLTVNGSGAYIGIAKAGNTYAYESGGVPTSIEYSVVSMAADYSTMTLAVKVTKDDGNIDYWTYKLEQQMPSPIAGRWRLANEAGSAGVGPAAGNVEWWSLGAGDLTARACFIDDVYVFGDYGSFTNEQGDQTWLENWQSGSDDACGAPLAPHNGSVDGTFTYADNKITITGAGNYIGIAKAGNTYAYESGGVPASIEYTVESMNADKTAMTLAVKVTKDDGNIDYWTYKLVKDVPSPIAGRWKLANEAGSAGVGPAAGNVEWWSLGAGDLTARASFMDDVYVFGEYGSFTNEQGDQTWLENWQSGSDDACGAPLAPHNGSVDGTFTYADNKITITGAGNYIGIAKAGNTYAYESGGVPASIEYTVQSMNADKTAMTLAVKVTKDDGNIDYWTYKLVKEAEAEASPIAGNWTLAQEVGAAGVGPSAGNVEWWSLGAGDLTARACFMDDVYTFGADGSFSNVQGSETWIENWQSDSDDACGAALAPHNGSVDGTFTYADNKITITGAGNYIGIAKAGNTYAYESGGVPASIEYSVESMSADYSAMTIAVKVTKDDGNIDYWTYKLVKSD